MAEAEHITALRKAFPGVWIREDGAFRDDHIGIFWAPGDVEKTDERLLHGAQHSGAYDGLCCFVGPGSGARGPALRLSQIRVLAEYIDATSRAQGEPLSQEQVREKD